MTDETLHDLMLRVGLVRDRPSPWAAQRPLPRTPQQPYRSAFWNAPETSQLQQLPSQALGNPNTLPMSNEPTLAQRRQRNDMAQFALQHEAARNEVNTPPGTYIGQDALEMTGLPSIARGIGHLRDQEPGQALPELAMGGLGVAGMFGAGGARTPRPRPPLRAALPELAAEAPTLPNAPARLPGRATDGSVLPIRPPQPIRQSMVGGSNDLAEAAGMRPPQAPDGGASGAGNRLSRQTVDIRTRNGQSHPTIRNPSEADIMRLTRAGEQRGARYIRDGDNIYVGNSYDVTHQDLIDAHGLPGRGSLEGGEIIRRQDGTLEIQNDAGAREMPRGWLRGRAPDAPNASNGRPEPPRTTEALDAGSGGAGGQEWGALENALRREGLTVPQSFDLPRGQVSLDQVETIHPRRMGIEQGRLDYQRSQNAASPIIVRRTQDGRYQIIDGGHRVSIARERGQGAIDAYDATDLFQARRLPGVRQISETAPRDRLYTARFNDSQTLASEDGKWGPGVYASTRPNWWWNSLGDVRAIPEGANNVALDLPDGPLMTLDEFRAIDMDQTVARQRGYVGVEDARLGEVLIFDEANTRLANRANTTRPPPRPPPRPKPPRRQQ